MSPQSACASNSSPRSAGAVNVFRKNDSPPNQRFTPLKRPPDCVCIARFGLMPTMAPDSAVIDSCGARCTRASAWAGRYRISTCIGSSARKHGREPADEALEVAGLDPDAPLPRQLAHEPLARRRQAEQPAPGAADREREV